MGKTFKVKTKTYIKYGKKKMSFIRQWLLLSHLLNTYWISLCTDPSKSSLSL